MVGISLEYATIFLDSSDRANIVIIASEHDSVESDFPSFDECQSEHLGCITFAAFTWSDSIPDMSAIFSEIRMIYRVAYLDTSEDYLSIHEEKERSRDFTVILREVIIS